MIPLMVKMAQQLLSNQRAKEFNQERRKRSVKDKSPQKLSK
jgi:hypothetical protein